MDYIRNHFQRAGASTSPFRLASISTSLLLCITSLNSRALALEPRVARGLDVHISVADGLLNSSTDGRISLMFAPLGVDPLDDTEVDSSPNLFFGQNVYNYGNSDTVTLSGGSGYNTRTGVYGWPNVSLDAIAPGEYTVQAFLNRYEKVKRSDGSVVSVRFPCGDGAPNVDGFGSLLTSAINVTVSGGSQSIDLTFDSVEPYTEFAGSETGGCNQGNYEDTANLKHIKIRSRVLSKFWNRDMYVGANVLLPPGYNAQNQSKRYPVVYSQGHWPAGNGAFRYSTSNFSLAWNSGIIPNTSAYAGRATPKFIAITFRHESPFYDDSYAVNTANIGPYGDAINDELIPYLDTIFNTVGQPYARLTEGGSTGGWISAANVIYRPDLFGACFSSYPDSLDFHKHQAIPLYDSGSAYTRPDGSKYGSIRTFANASSDVETVLATVEQENHWELTFGTSSRSFLQWDVWNAVFGVQGLNNYPLEPWNKVTGQIDLEAVEYWKPFDLSHYITYNWRGRKNLGEVLKNRIFIYVGSHDTYYLNEGVEKFRDNVASYGGPNWANVTILPGKIHGGNYQSREIWDYLLLLDTWFKDHAPDGKTPLSKKVTTPTSRGNDWNEVIARGGHQAALARQAPPKIYSKSSRTVEGSVGRWDSAVTLEGQWKVDGKVYGNSFGVRPGQKVTYVKQRKGGKIHVQLLVTGTKMGYVAETRTSNTVIMG